MPHGVPPEWDLIVPGCKFDVEKVDENNFWVDVRVETRLLRFRLAEPVTSSDEAFPDASDIETPTMIIDKALADAREAQAQGILTKSDLKEIDRALIKNKKSMAQDKKALDQAGKALVLARAALAKVRNVQAQIKKRPAAPEITYMKRPRL
jgi:hypothetical protein